MAKGRLGYKEVTKAKFWRIITSEFIGTFLVVFVGSLAVSKHDGRDVLLNVSLLTGMSYTVAIFTFGNHGYFNPAIATSLFLTNKIPFVRTLAFVLIQLCGAVAAQALVGYVMVPGAWYSKYGPGALLPRDDIPLPELFTILSVVAGVFSAIVYTHSSPYVIGLAASLATLVIFPFTMGSINPARSLSSNIVALRFPCYSWVYGLAPVVGASLGRLAMLGGKKLVTTKFKDADIASKPLLAES